MNATTKDAMMELGEPVPVIRSINASDLRAALANGLDDFKAKPSHIILLVIMYPLLGLVLMRITDGQDLLPLAFPLISGFALVGPLVATGLYELSRRREKGLEIAWKHAFDVVHSPSIGAIVRLGLLLLAIYFLWLIAALGVYQLAFGNTVQTSMMSFASQVMTTPSGWFLIIFGTGLGFVFAVVVLAISAVSFPLLLDKPVGTTVAIKTSIAAFRANPVAMLQWGAIVAFGLALGSVPFFVGLAVVMPVLGHATWHLYRRVVAN